MALPSGTRLGPYEIQDQLGAGGMGEVYRARDSRLGRTVAVKILPAHLSDKPEARERFEREARSISSLSHPNICHLYDVGLHDSTSYLVMEYVEGETLADRLRKGPLPLDQVLKIGIEICDGLEKAHRSGIIHRDLKPGNVMLTKAGAKLMDFGLAKAVAEPAVQPSASSATLEHLDPARPLTARGTVVGTFQYMSPEQIEGREVDARSDIFALGAVLYEMAAGRRAFDGQSPASVMAAILEREPPTLSSLQPFSPPALDDVVRICLAKNPDDRWQAVHDVKVQLRRIAAGGSQAALPALAARRSRWDRAAWPLAALLLIILAAVSVAAWLRSREAPPAMYFNASVPFAGNDMALSPDGRSVALVAFSDQANKYMLWKYAVGGRGAEVLPGTEDATHPFWSPDSRSLAFFSQGKLKRIDVASGSSPQTICDAPHGRGGSWGRDGVILFTPEAYGGIYRVSSAGGTPVQVTSPDQSRGQISNRWASFLPDGRHFLFLEANFAGATEKNAIYVGSLDSPDRHLVVKASSNAVYAEPGYLLYIRDNALVAQPFDPNSFDLTGDPRILSDSVQYFPQIDLALFGVAGRHTLVVQTGKGADKSQFSWFDRNGKQVGSVGPAGLFSNPAISPDGRRVVFEQTDRDGRHVDIWLRDLAADVVSRVSFGPGLDELPTWSPDGKRVAFSANQHPAYTLYLKNADGSGSQTEIANLGGVLQATWDWSRDGKYILMYRTDELWYMTWPDRKAQQFVKTRGVVRNAQFSPDGRWVAYASNETGAYEIYVTPFPAADSKWQVSRDGGEEPRWRRDGKELFYLSGKGGLMAVSVKPGPSFEAGEPVPLFQAHLRQPISVLDMVSYDVSADGQRFLVNTKVDDPNPSPLTVVLNWSSEMQK